ncbi:putative Zf-FLZ domain, FCS-Like Zinc finger/14 [Helianthus annuus]|nr:putative Zf-FLZ domain, FCS-Like Zinc finger/14 [Helianthus annuus]
MSAGKKRRAVIGKLVTSGQRVEAGGSSPRSPLDLKILVSPKRGVLNVGGGVGLGIVAALGDEPEEEEEEDDEEYTIVTRHMPNNNSYRKVYDGKGNSTRCVLDISPVDVKGDFLSCCHECNKRLDGRDVYMYRGERPFCSIECRARAIWMEQQQEEERRSCGSQAAPSPSSSSDVATTGGIFAII